MSYWSSVYVLDINPGSDIQLANIFSHSIDCLFILLLVSFAVKKILVVKSRLFVFSFVAFTLGAMSKKVVANTQCQVVHAPVFSSRSFVV